MKRTMVIMVVAGLLFAGCASMVANIPVHALRGQPAAKVERDEDECAAWAKGATKVYRGCMLARGYRVHDTVSFPGVGAYGTPATVSYLETQSTDPDRIVKDLQGCEADADKARDTALPTTQAKNAEQGKRHVACIRERGFLLLRNTSDEERRQQTEWACTVSVSASLSASERALLREQRAAQALAPTDAVPDAVRALRPRLADCAQRWGYPDMKWGAADR